MPLGHAVAQTELDAAAADALPVVLPPVAAPPARDMAMQMPLETVTMKATPRTTKFRLPVISLNRNSPHIAATNPGPLVTSGNATAKLRALLAMNQDTFSGGGGWRGGRGRCCG